MIHSPEDNSPEDTRVTCLICNCSFCINCREDHSSEINCWDLVFSRHGKVEDFFIEAIDKFLIMKCPRCGKAEIKNEGCNKITCQSCRAHYCYCCGKLLDGLNPYDHFGTSQGLCALWPPSEFVNDQPRYNYNIAKEKALGLVSEWLRFRLENKLPIDGLLIEERDDESERSRKLTEFLDTSLERLERENQFD